MANIVGNWIGLIHLITAVLALFTGTLILIKSKGSKYHKQIGYVYALSMSIMLITSFMIYRLFNGIGIFHFFSILSTYSLMRGMYAILRRKSKNFLTQHFHNMYWSVMGLYGAFVAEIMVRLPFSNLFNNNFKPTGMFYNIVGITVGVVMVIATFSYLKLRPKWANDFIHRSKE